MTSAAIYARVSSARQREEQTIASQTTALVEAAELWELEVPTDWVFEDEGFSGATLVRPALERLRDLAAQVPVDVVLCYSPDRLARKYAYQALLIDEFARAGTEVRFVKSPRAETPEDELLIQFQGMIAEYERAQIAERTRRGKTHRARAGVVNVLGGAPYGYRYVRRSDDADARYEIVDDQAAVVRELFRVYVEDNVSIADLVRWLGAQGIATVTGKERWDRSTVWGMLRNPAYAGRAAYLKTGRIDGTPVINRTARLQGRPVSRHARTRPRPSEDWIEIAVPAIVDDDTFAAARRRLEDNRRFSARNTKEPSLLLGLVSCQSCGYAYYRTSTRTKKRKLYYYRCLGSDDYRYEHGRVCDNKPVRADYLDELVWGQVTALLADPTLVQAELDRRLSELRAANPATAERSRLELELTRATKGIERLVHAYQEDLLTLDELRAHMPDLRAREAGLRSSLASLESQLLDRDTYLKLAENLEGFLSRLRDTADTATVEARQKVLRSVVKDVLVGPQRVVIRHSIPGVDHPFRPAGYRLRLRCHHPSLGCPRFGIEQFLPVKHARVEKGPQQLEHAAIRHPLGHQGEKLAPVDAVEEGLDVDVDDPVPPLLDRRPDGVQGLVGRTPRTKAIGAVSKVRLVDRLQQQLRCRLHAAVGHAGDAE
jgi:site-specific DNA recombinase